MTAMADWVAATIAAAAAAIWIAVRPETARTPEPFFTRLDMLPLLRRSMTDSDMNDPCYFTPCRGRDARCALACRTANCVGRSAPVLRKSCPQLDLRPQPKLPSPKQARH